MERLPSTRGSPSEQLAAFSPMGYEAFAQRGNPVPLPGLSTIRPIGDPFAGWNNETRPGLNVPATQEPTTTASPASASSVSAYAYAAQAFERANVLTQAVAPATLEQANKHTSANQLEYSSASPHVSPANACPGGMQYSPSQAIASRSLDQIQYSPHSPTHARARLGGSQYLLSPVQTAIANTRYSPSRQGFSYEYNPVPPFISNLFATTNSPAVGDAHATPAHIDPQTGRPTGTTHSRSPTSGTHDVAEKYRSFIVHNVPLDTSHRSIVMMFPIEEYPSLQAVCLKHIATRGVFSFSFSDLRETINAMNKIRSTRPGWRVFPSTAQEIATLNGSNDSVSSPAPAPQDGAFLLSVFTSRWLMEPMDGVVQDVVASLGTLRSCKLIENGPNMSRYHVEYFNLRHATYAFSCLNGFKLDSLCFDVFPVDVKEELPILSQVQTPSRVNHLQTPSRVPPQSPVTPYDLVSKGNEIEEKVDFSPALEAGKTRKENIIHIDRIIDGLDVRSTVMIRNIPNKITADQLKMILDESSFGKYDFLYLRMDFTHRCNVGYAFMNFGDPIDILTLIHAREGKSWPDCISSKRTEISYATLQGKDTLISKFRNSHVMTRPHDEQPRLFYLDGPRAGSEMPFPAPNDASKLRRSVASTTQQGLFSPRPRVYTTPRNNRTRPQSQSFSQTSRGQASIRSPRNSGGQLVQHTPNASSGFSPMRAGDRQFTSPRQSQSFSQTSRGQASIRGPQNIGGQLVQYDPNDSDDSSPVKVEDRQFTSPRN
ncbi:RNA recognition motif 2 [Penicillium cf. griseofulvum]|uniref:RNA recognition motif 2 n=1 Tax=Penicillium cf. griseofulvum TaxID=2972120 RepID=A0A9W9MQP7_9EURO|nr:RNA recognition motif 2 [Penicillium cf. griseofulvum]KAJ5441352.1 RNA recognition motif 2 [Penicillium cf. griseofulvum]KAJ5449405.1 RNA recognition motif 2 [Penicillium cf. griseofulvum]